MQVEDRKGAVCVGWNRSYRAGSELDEEEGNPSMWVKECDVDGKMEVDSDYAHREPTTRMTTSGFRGSDPGVMPATAMLPSLPMKDFLRLEMEAVAGPQCHAAHSEQLALSMALITPSYSGWLESGPLGIDQRLDYAQVTTRLDSNGE